MTANQLFDFKTDLDREQVLFCYSGPVSQGLIEEIGETIKRKMKAEETTLSIIQKVFGVFVEQVQNIMYHSAETKCDDSGNQLRSGVAVIGRDGGEFYILCGNLVEQSEREQLEALLRELDGKNREELDVMYKERLKADFDEIGHGAGLGLIEVARRSGGRLSYCFRDVDSDHCFFSSKATVE